jgi:fatty-acid desaturase
MFKEISLLLTHNMTKTWALLTIHCALFFNSVITEFSWWYFLLGFVLYKTFSMIGVEIGLHRLWSHRSFKTTRLKEYVLGFFAVPALLGSSINFSTIHRKHHAYSDTDRDPHTIRPWWKMMFHFYKAGTYNAKSIIDLARDPLHVLMHRYYYKIHVAILVGMLILTGPVFTGWTLSFMIVAIMFSTGLINIFGHRPEFGTQIYDTKDQSCNNYWLQLWTWNHGLHHNHHAFPKYYRYTMNPGEWDVPAWVIEKFFLIKESKAQD